MGDLWYFPEGRRLPWGWRVRIYTLPKRAMHARFGGGWQWRIGVTVGRSPVRSVLVDLIWVGFRFDRG